MKYQEWFKGGLMVKYARAREEIRALAKEERMWFFQMCVSSVFESLPAGTGKRRASVLHPGLLPQTNPEP